MSATACPGLFSVNGAVTYRRPNALANKAALAKPAYCDGTRAMPSLWEATSDDRGHDAADPYRRSTPFRPAHLFQPPGNGPDPEPLQPSGHARRMARLRPRS